MPLPEPKSAREKYSRGTVLAINAGSSSIRFGLYAAARLPVLRLRGKLDRIGLAGASLTVSDSAGQPLAVSHPTTRDHTDAVAQLLDWLEAQGALAALQAVGHRVVHGLRHSAPARVTPKLLAELHRITPWAPEHLPREIALIEALARRFPRLPQIACFDTAFHRTMPPVARRLPLPRRYAAHGVERYGFHGLSCSSLLESLRRLDPAAARGRVLLAHLGNGSSLTAVHRGRSVDTSMGFTPASGLVMGTRCGDVDPGLPYFLARTERITPARFHRLVNHESGLLGVSGVSSDMRELLAAEAASQPAADALELYCYQAKKWIGSFAAVLGGIDTLVFAGGIGENCPSIRARICEGLKFLAVALDRRRNLAAAEIISPSASPVTVRIIHTDEELMIAKLSLPFIR